MECVVFLLSQGYWSRPVKIIEELEQLAIRAYGSSPVFASFPEDCGDISQRCEDGPVKGPVEPNPACQQLARDRRKMQSKHASIMKQDPVHQDAAAARQHLKRPAPVAPLHGLACIVICNTARLILDQPASLPSPIGNFYVLKHGGEGIKSAHFKKFFAIVSRKGADCGEGQKGGIYFGRWEDVVISISAPHAAAKSPNLASVAENIPVLIEHLAGYSENVAILEMLHHRRNAIRFEADITIQQKDYWKTGIHEARLACGAEAKVALVFDRDHLFCIM